MKIFYIGNQTAGLIGKLTILSEGHTLVNRVEDSDVLLCVHGREIISRDVFEKPKIGAINVHPYLYAYKGADPVGRAIKDHNWKASVGCHYITEEVDRGAIIAELFVEVHPSENRAEIYNQLYGTYSEVIKVSLNRLEQRYKYCSPKHCRHFISRTKPKSLYS